VRERRHGVLITVPDRDRDLDLVQAESPVADERQVVITPPRDAAAQRIESAW